MLKGKPVVTMELKCRCLKVTEQPWSLGHWELGMVLIISQGVADQRGQRQEQVKFHGTRWHFSQALKEQEALWPSGWGKGGCPSQRAQHKAKTLYQFLIAAVANVVV